MGRLELKLMALLILLTGLPLGVALWRAGVLFERSLGAGLNPLVSQALDDAVQVYGAYVHAEKGRFRALGEGLAASQALREAAEGGQPALAAWLAREQRRPGVFGLALERAGATPLEQAEAPPAGWLTRTETFPITGLPGFTGLRLTYGTEAERLARFRSMERDVIEPFRALESDRRGLAGAYAWSFVGYLALAVLLAALVSVVTARRVTRRLRQLRAAMTAVAGGDLAARVPVSGRDEVADLSQGFNEMATRLAESQARVQYLTQVSVWQGIARKLAHEIKNPLTPILLAAQQAHESYKGDDARHQRVLETAREIVEQEVHVLKRLVENFSRFARLPGVSRRWRTPPRSAGMCSRPWAMSRARARRPRGPAARRARSRSAAPGADQPGAQRRRRLRRGRAARPHPPAALPRARRRGAHRRGRQRARRPAGRPRSHLRPLRHRQAGRYRPGSRHRQEDRPGPRRGDRRRGERPGWCAVRRDAARACMMVERS
ncbi:MAG: HAMP domain-containing protein [bacterium]